MCEIYGSLMNAGFTPLTRTAGALAGYHRRMPAGAPAVRVSWASVIVCIPATGNTKFKHRSQKWESRARAKLAQKEVVRVVPKARPAWNVVQPVQTQGRCYRIPGAMRLRDKSMLL